MTRESQSEGTRALLKHPGGEAGLGLENRGWLARPVHPPGGGLAGLGWAVKETLMV
jgi:hypothetical protein